MRCIAIFIWDSLRFVGDERAVQFSTLQRNFDRLFISAYCGDAPPNELVLKFFRCNSDQILSETFPLHGNLV